MQLKELKSNDFSANQFIKETQLWIEAKQCTQKMIENAINRGEEEMKIAAQLVRLNKIRLEEVKASIEEAIQSANDWIEVKNKETKDNE